MLVLALEEGVPSEEEVGDDIEESARFLWTLG